VQQLHRYWILTFLVLTFSFYFIYSIGRVSGAVWGGSGVKVGMINYVALEMAIVGIGVVSFLALWRDLKAKKG